MRVTVLGSSASYAGPSQACAGHLVQEQSCSILLDCGSGVLSNAGRVMTPGAIDAVFITHYHPDHYLDLFGLQAMLRYAPEGPSEPMPVYTPEGLADRMKALLSPRGGTELDEAFRFSDLHDGDKVCVGPFTVTPVAVDHTEPTFALRVEAQGSLLAYTSDSAPGEGLYRATAGADLILSEATLPEGYAGESPHLTSRQAGEIARAAGAGRLVLVHAWPTNDRNAMAREATKSFGRPVVVAGEMDTFEII